MGQTEEQFLIQYKVWYDEGSCGKGLKYRI